MICRYVEKYDFSKVIFRDPSEAEYSPDGFVIKTGLTEFPGEETVLWDMGGSVRIRFRLLQPEDEKTLDAYEAGECYFQKTDEHGCVPVLEAEITLNSPEHPHWKSMKLGINLLMYDLREKDLYILYDTVNFRLIFDGVVVNHNMPFGTLAAPAYKGMTDRKHLSAPGYSSRVADARYYRENERVDKKFNYYTPHGHNTFIGDVANFCHNGVYHLLYMPDRHHHKNRWGGGGHHFEHMITRDFVTWEDVGPIWDVTKPWESTGTGTMCFHKGKYYVAFGLHTSRTIPEDKLCTRELRRYSEEHGKTRIVTYEELESMGKYPSGANYAVSDDGIRFQRGNKIFSACENPSVYARGDALIMYAGYGDSSAWRSEDFDQPWEPVETTHFTCGEHAAMRNTSECPSFFEWNGYQYLIMGVTGFWRTEKGGKEYIDVASRGYDVYDGLCVPMVAKTEDDRAILAGWTGGMDWGSMVVHRELIQYENGDLGMKWMPELFPDIRETDIRMSSGFMEIRERRSYYLEAEIDGSAGKADIRFIDRDGHMCELRLDTGKGTAQYGSGKYGDSIPDILPMYQAIRTAEQTRCGFGTAPEDLPHRSKDFAIARIRYPDGTYRIKILLYYFEKNNYTIIDTEIAQTRTLITARKNFLPARITVSENVRNVRLCEADL